MSDWLHKLHEEKPLRVRLLLSALFNDSRCNHLTSSTGQSDWIRPLKFLTESFTTKEARAQRASLDAVRRHQGDAHFVSPRCARYGAQQSFAPPRRLSQPRRLFGNDFRESDHRAVRAETSRDSCNSSLQLLTNPTESDL